MRPYVIDVVTSTTAGSTEFPKGFKLIQVKNMDAVIAITISFEDEVGTASNPEAILPAEGAVNYANESNSVKCNVVYHDAASGTPTLRITGYVE